MKEGTGLSCGRDWGAVPLRHEQYQWSMEADGPLVQGPVALTDRLGQRMLLNLDPGQFALLIGDNSLKAVYLDGSHHLDIGGRENQLQTHQHLIFLTTDQSLGFRITEGLTGPAGDSVIGRCSVRIEKPSRFFQRVLKPHPQWTESNLSTILEPMILEAFKALVEDVGSHACDHSGGLQSALMSLEAHQLDEYLQEYGLYCEAIAAYTAAPPVEDCCDQTAGQSAQLLHN